MGDLVIYQGAVIFVIVCLNNKAVFHKTIPGKPDIPFFIDGQGGAKSVKRDLNAQAGRLLANMHGFVAQ